MSIVGCSYSAEILFNFCLHALLYLTSNVTRLPMIFIIDSFQKILNHNTQAKFRGLKSKPIPSCSRARRPCARTDNARNHASRMAAMTKKWAPRAYYTAYYPCHSSPRHGSPWPTWAKLTSHVDLDLAARLVTRSGVALGGRLIAASQSLSQSLIFF